MKLTFREDTVEKVSAYPNIMYRRIDEGSDRGLRTGDIVHLNPKDFKKFLRYFSSLEPLLNQFAGDLRYHSGLWAILNKPCDMVHDGNGRTFDKNLFLCPLQSFLSELTPTGLFKSYVQQPLAVEKYSEVLNDVLKKDIKKLVDKRFPITKETLKKDIKNITNEKKLLSRDLRDSIDKEMFTDFDDFDDPEMVEGALKAYAVDGNFHDFLTPLFEELVKNKDWTAFKKERDSAIKENKSITLTKTGVKNINELFLNQMDSKGIFYYEPNYNFLNYSKRDFSFFIELEDMLTFKIQESAIEKGVLVDLLVKNRVLGLDRNFSDRLQNIMGYYFSKIGTKDVKTTSVLNVYDSCFENFIAK